jgi:hypothetical protein
MNMRKLLHVESSIVIIHYEEGKKDCLFQLLLVFAKPEARS